MTKFILSQGRLFRSSNKPLSLYIYHHSQLTYMTDDINIERIVIDKLQSGEDSIERGLLVASGCETEEQIDNYTAKIDELDKDFKKWYAIKSNSYTLRTYMKIKQKSFSEDYQIAKALFKYLWKIKSKTFFSKKTDKSHSLLTDAIDLNLFGHKEICLSSSSLYASLGLRNNLSLSILYHDSHILLVLDDDKKKIAIETTASFGFDYKRSFSLYKNIYSGNLIHLIAATFNTRADIKAMKEDFNGAREDLNKATELNPKYKEAFRNINILEDYILKNNIK